MSSNYPHSSYIALVDCNNFFVSCERLFRPDLLHKPVIVLSSNDGCVISRSNEAKLLGFKMGEPYFKVKEQCVRHNVAVFSSNFALYRDVSRRVMHTLRRFSDDVEVYSVDEAFIGVPLPQRHQVTPAAVYLAAFAEGVRKAVVEEVGIPVTVGVSPTKTLAKVASHLAKEAQKALLTGGALAAYRAVGVWGEGVGGIADERTRAHALAATPIEDVWGVGFRLAPRLRAMGVATAHALQAQPDLWVQKRMSVCGLRTVLELRGTRCFGVGEDTSLRKSLLHSQSFGKAVFDLATVRSAVAHHARKIAEILRAEGVQAREVGVLIRTSRHVSRRYSTYDHDVLPMPTNDTLELVDAALQVLGRIYRPGFGYAKAGVVVRDIVAEGAVPERTLFSEPTSTRKSLMRTLDELRHTYGDIVRMGAEGMETWRPKHELLSPAYTTRWGDVRRIRLP